MKTIFRIYETPSCESILLQEETVLCQSVELAPITDNTGDIEWEG